MTELKNIAFSKVPIKLDKYFAGLSPFLEVSLEYWESSVYLYFKNDCFCIKLLSVPSISEYGYMVVKYVLRINSFNKFS